MQNILLTLAGFGTEKNRFVSPDILRELLSMIAPPPSQKFASGITLKQTNSI